MTDPARHHERRPRDSDGLSWGRGEGPRPDILLSDRDYGLCIVEYTGKRPKGT